MPEPEELSREQLEEQLMKGEFEEAPEGLPSEALGEASPEVKEEAQAPTFEELQARLAEVEQEIAKRDEEIRQRSGALSEERDKRRVAEGQYAQLMDYIKEVRERAAHTPEPQPEEDYSEYQEYLTAVEKKFGPVMRQMAERQAQLEHVVSQQYQMQYQAQQFAQQSKQFSSQKQDYNDAMNFLVDRIRQRATIFIPDANQREAVIAQEAQNLINYSPEQLYNLAMVDGYTPKTPEQPTQPAAPALPNRPKSMATIAGATGNLPDNIQTKAANVINANFEELSKMKLEDLDAILKNVK